MPRDLLAQTLLAAAFLAMAIVPGANAQKDDIEAFRRGPPPATGPAQITLYSDTGLRGTSVTLTGSAATRTSARLHLAILTINHVIIIFGFNPSHDAIF